jgi:ankyrin repeat protein
MWASQGGHADAVKLLLAAQADVEVKEKVRLFVCSLVFTKARKRFLNKSFLHIEWQHCAHMRKCVRPR